MTHTTRLQQMRFLDRIAGEGKEKEYGRWPEEKSNIKRDGMLKCIEKKVGHVV